MPILNFTKPILRKIVEEQFSMIIRKPLGIEREKLSSVAKKRDSSHVIVITGIRRCGKSTLLRQIIHEYYNDRDFYYVNFDDERFLGFTSQHFDSLHEVLIEQFGEQQVFFFDEIQNVPDFERFVRRLHDLGHKVYMTGSNETLLGGELSTKLTGRHLDIELFPFSFREFLELKGVDLEGSSHFTTKGRVQMVKMFDEYMDLGGMPEFLKHGDYEILQALYDDIIFRDIVYRYNVKNVKALRQMIQYLFSNIGHKTNYSRLKNFVNVKSANTIKNYLLYLKQTYLGFLIPKLDYSVKKQIVSNQKFYAVDPGFVNHLSTNISKDFGWLLENLAFIHLRRHYPLNQIFYHYKNTECDFVILQGTQIKKAIQITYFLNEKTREREVEGMKTIFAHFPIDKGTILTYEQEEQIKLPNGTVEVLPMWKWLMRYE